MSLHQMTGLLWFVKRPKLGVLVVGPACRTRDFEFLPSIWKEILINFSVVLKNRVWLLFTLVE